MIELGVPILFEVVGLAKQRRIVFFSSSLAKSFASSLARLLSCNVSPRQPCPQGTVTDDDDGTACEERVGAERMGSRDSGWVEGPGLTGLKNW